MYNNCEKTMKLLAKVCPILMFIVFAALLPIIDCFDLKRYLLGSLGAVVFVSILLGAIGAFIGYLLGSFIYGFAEIVENVKKTNKQEQHSSTKQCSCKPK